MRSTFGSLVNAFRKREPWFVGIFLFLYYFNPGLNTPLYYYMTDDLQFSQGYIGVLGSIEAAGRVVGALLYRRFFEDISSKWILNLSIVLGTVTTAAFVFLAGETSAAILNFCSGFFPDLGLAAALSLISHRVSDKPRRHLKRHNFERRISWRHAFSACRRCGCRRALWGRIQRASDPVVAIEVEVSAGPRHGARSGCCVSGPTWLVPQLVPHFRRGLWHTMATPMIMARRWMCYRSAGPQAWRRFRA